MARVEHTKEEQRSDQFANMFTLFTTLNSAWNKVSSGGLSNGGNDAMESGRARGDTGDDIKSTDTTNGI